MRQVFRNAIIGVVLAGVIAPVFAEEKEVEEAIETRRAVFEVIKWNFAPMGAMVKGAKPFDKADFAMRAERVAVLSKMPWEAFIKGSDVKTTKAEHNEAKPEIWTDAADFKAKVDAFETQSAKLAEVAKAGDEAAMKAQFAEVGKTCKACHEKYRED